MSFRKEEKLKVHKNQLLNLLSWIDENKGYELFKPRIVSSTYFDNDEMDMFKDSEEGSVPRKKIRVRSYTSNKHTQKSSNLEVKISSVEGRYKTTTKKNNIEKILKIGIFDPQYGICKPLVRVTYERSYYKVCNVRMTIDRNISYTPIKNNMESKFKIIDQEIIVEIKANNNITDNYLFKMFPFERTRFSKYSRAINSTS